MSGQQRGNGCAWPGSEEPGPPTPIAWPMTGVLFGRGLPESPVRTPARCVTMVGLLASRCTRVSARPGHAVHLTRSAGELRWALQHAWYGFDNTVLIESGRLRAADGNHRWLATGATLGRAYEWTWQGGAWSRTAP